MKSATVNEIKLELQQLKPKELVDICLRLSRFKKENKELLTYLLFEQIDEDAFVRQLKDEITLAFEEMNASHLYFAKKTLRKIVRTINKYSRYSSVKETEIELRLHFCQTLKESGIPYEQNAVILNLFNGQKKKLQDLVVSLHEDLQYEYNKRIKSAT